MASEMSGFCTKLVKVADEMWSDNQWKGEKDTKEIKKKELM